ncbi:protein tramtrack, alpha isoform-like isoform X1 [Eriocheir sinensis]|uniref:protein tramtrack, alpha isoform-like isoform X1 n=1 Tax=Eriocheir sinensis TaxID=95602 RepID=UPI0021C63CC4|nr:protein tramtrack, alpha isoform-like isoform X1 [Eriocheir sinensis]XP_050728562.1 protein tramtrack, alpha isoform-like isoform X1 [Eriocheir sinensis]XP_050728563.1 protein tramtrack, alpha isoform-like isoform X1 [Eriocheir sinensis]
MPPVEIQWCDHSSVLLEYLRQLYEECRFVDVGLECEGRQVKAHKAVISACSPYLEGLLKGNPARSHLIKFNGYSYNSLRAVIDFMYNGKVMVEQEHLAAFLKLGRALQVRGILDIAAQCEEAGLTTAEETKFNKSVAANAQYSTTVQQPQKPVSQPQAQSKMVQQATGVSELKPETKKYAFLLDKGSPNAPKKLGPQFRKVMPNIIGSVDQQGNINKVTSVGAAQVAQQQQQQQSHQQQAVQQTQPQQTVQQVVQEQPQPVQEEAQQQQQQQLQQQSEEGGQGQQQEAAPTTLEELQQALSSGQAILQTTDNGSEQTLQMVEGQCVMTGSGQTYVVVQEGDNISFVPAEMVQGDLGAVNGGQQVVEGLDPVEQQLAQMEGQVLTHNQVTESTEPAQQESSGVPVSSGAAVSGDSGSLETMSVVESLVKLGEKQPTETENGSTEETPEVGPDMPSLDGDETEDRTEVGASMPCLGDVTEEEGVPASGEGGDAEGGAGQEEAEESAEGSTGEEIGKRKRQPSQKMIEAMGMLKRKVPESPTQGGGRGKKLKN